MSYIIPLAKRLPLTLADIVDGEDRVFIYCAVCGRKKEMLVHHLRMMVGPIAFGVINGRFSCRGRGGCGKAIGMVLPRIAPTPEAWARLYRPSAKDPGVKSDAPEDDFPFHIELWCDKPSSRNNALAQVKTYEMAVAAFDLAKPSKDLGRDEYILLRHRGRVLKDSRRDFKVVKSDKEPH